MIKAFLSHSLDKLALKLAQSDTADHGDQADQLANVQQLLADPDFFCDSVGPPEDITFYNRKEFVFSSPIVTPWRENNTVYCRLYRCGPRWEHQPSVILLHGWNGELAYRYQFPYLTWRFLSAGLNVVTVELPYHGKRKPARPGAVTNFISTDLLRTIEAVRQAIGEVRSLLAWLEAQGSPRLALWGCSLGAWLSGLIACHAPSVQATALVTPLVSLVRAVADLPFCEPLRRRLQGAELDTNRLHLTSHRPCHGPGGILLVASQHDLITPADTAEELWQSWGRPEIWRTSHGHISVLLSAPIMQRTVQWVAGKVKE